MAKNTTQTVLFLCHYSSSYGGNFIPSLLTLDKALAAKDIKCVYAFPEKAGQSTWYKQLGDIGKTVITVDVNKSRWQKVKDIKNIVKKYNISLIHSHFYPMLPLEIFSFLNPKIRIFIHLHSDWSLGKKSVKDKIKFFFLCKLFALRIKFLSVSRALVAYNPSKITYVPNALAVNRLPCKEIDITVLRQKIGLKSGQKLCEIFAWSPKVKGLDIAVEAVKQLNSQGVPLKLAIVYGLDLPPEKLKSWISINTSCKGTEEFLCYLPPDEDVFGYHKAADILISASRSEGFSYSILEMLSLGKPCVISDIPGVAWAKDFDGVFVFKSENIPACTAALNKALETQSNFPKTAEQIHKQYNIDNWVKNIIEQYGK